MSAIVRRIGDQRRSAENASPRPSHHRALSDSPISSLGEVLPTPTPTPPNPRKDRCLKKSNSKSTVDPSGYARSSAQLCSRPSSAHHAARGGSLGEEACARWVLARTSASIYFPFLAARVAGLL